MTVPTLIWPPSRARLKRQPRVKTARFGDGYEQRLTDGLHPNLETWDLTWAGLVPAIAADLDTFLLARGAMEPFYYTTKLNRQILCVCRTWDVGDAEGQAVDVSATFEEVPG